MSTVAASHINQQTFEFDPLLTLTTVKYRKLFFPCGFPALVSSNSKEVIEAAEISWSHHPPRFDRRELDIRCFVAESDRPACSEVPVFRSQQNLLTIVADRENFATLDFDSGFSFGWVNSSTVRSTQYFRHCLLDAMVYLLLEIRDLATLHAACVMYEGRGILLGGESGAGKSSLSYACARSGWTFVCDDASAFARNAEIPEIIGHPQTFRFRDRVGEIFPEFCGLKSNVPSLGKPTIEVDTAGLTDVKVADTSPITAIVFLNRAEYRSGPPKLRALTKDDAWERLTTYLWAIQHPAFSERLNALRRLLDRPILEMCYREFEPAIELLQNLALELPA